MLTSLVNHNISNENLSISKQHHDIAQKNISLVWILLIEERMTEFLNFVYYVNVHKLIEQVGESITIQDGIELTTIINTTLNNCNY